MNDEVSGWLEDHLRPSLDTAHREFLWQYLSIYDQWARFHVDHPGLDDQASLAYLAERAEDALRGIAADKPTRLWLSVIRSIPLPVVAHIAMTEKPSHLVELVKIASAAASLHGDRKPSMPDTENILSVEPEWLEDFKQGLSIEVPRFIGAAHTWYYARGWYRIAGKGGVLAPPAPVDMKAARASLDALPPNTIMLVPSAVFRNDAELRPQVADYDRRSHEAGSAAITGLLKDDVRARETQRDPFSWWTVGVQTTAGKQVAISYPLLNRTLITSSYILIPDELNLHLARLAPFASLMPSRVGMALEPFGLCCRAVAAILRIQTGYMELRPLAADDDGTLRFRAEHTLLDVEADSASFLFSVMHRGLLRAPKSGWLDEMARLMSQGGSIHPRPDAEKFVATFTRERCLDADLEPSLFLEVDQRTLALDLLAMPEFFEFCLRRITSLDDAPNPEARRGARFEQSVWAFLNRQLPVDLVVDLNTRLSEGTAQGEIDVAFRFGDAIVILECKSWQKRIGYFRGDRASIDGRHKQLRRIVDGQMARNVTLLRRSLGLDKARDVLSFVCVAGPEFVKRGYPGLWYGATQRVLTPPEIVALFADEPRWRATIAASHPKAGS